MRNFLVTLSLLALTGTLVAQEPAKEEDGEAKQKKEFEIGDVQALDAFTSLEDGTPGAPGESEIKTTAGWLNSREARNAYGGEVEFVHTFSGNTFFNNMELGLTLEGERADLMNSNRYSAQDFQSFLLGRFAKDPTPLSITDTPYLVQSFLASRNILDRHTNETFRSVGSYAMGQYLSGPTGITNLNTIYNYQLARVAFDPSAAGNIQPTYTIDNRRRQIESSGAISPGWLQRWVADGGPDSAVPTISTVVEIGLPLTEKAESGEEIATTLAILKTFGFGTVVLNGFGTAVVGNSDRSLRASYFGGRVGFRHDIEIHGEEDDHRMNLIFALVHQMSEVRNEQGSTTFEFAVQYLLGGDMSIGPGIAVGLDHHEATPRFSFGVTALF